MADDASGNDGDDRGEPSPTSPDVQNSDGEQNRPGDSWRTSEQDTRNTPDEWISADTGVEADDSDDEYRVPLDLSPETEKTEPAGSDADEGAGDGEEEDDPYAPEPRSTPIEPGDPDLEHTVFVFLGAIMMALVMFQVISIAL
ncbi:hypothetical protein GS429_01915 [Natronorubrum sp. JWXQ-INN-674]|uniref:DUF7312 domain-containing protein n=1 Tax=Natronorubrum halalkaliphilum TaxID=2691917 RepID=A0A6B0VIS6_9EURY|nr:hypothetical protein [Natronorubrum halalkaliphilum]MXV60846.1 hypothetical protein [Natronorubrum halalkaliphilum]